MSSPMKTVPAGLASFVAQSATQDQGTVWAQCWLITRTDATAFAFTSHDQPIVVSGITYEPALSFKTSATRFADGTQDDNSEVLGVLDSSTITEADIQAGKYDNASVQIFLVDWASPSSGIIKIKQCYIGQVSRQQNQFTAELNGLSYFLKTYYGNFFQPNCRNDFGDNICNFDTSTGSSQLGTPAEQTGVVATQAGDQRTFTATGLSGEAPRTITYNSAGTLEFGSANGVANFQRILDSASGFTGAGFIKYDFIYVSGSAYNDSQYIVNTAPSSAVITVGVNLTYEKISGADCTISARTAGFFDGGTITWTGGNNTGLTQDVRTWDGTSQIVLLLQMPYPIQVGDTFTIVAGCDKRLSTCVRKWGNLLGNATGSTAGGGFNAEPFVPGENAALTYASQG
jgi:uncharacterized phage protein (TIGR02218 family)